MPKLKLVIEIDGGIHELEDVKKNDTVRENNLKDLGLKMLRFKNEEIIFHLETVIKVIEQKIHGLQSSPLGAGGHIFLIGMMGTGKSYWAQRIAASKNIDWMDLDAQIEKEALMTIKEIFETQGEIYFRNKEKEALHQLASFKNIVIATGGGTPCFHDNMQWMNKHGITIWIDEPVEILAERLKKEKAHRPLIKDLNDEELLHFLSIKLSERSKFYNQCHHHLQADKISAHSFDEILQQHA